LQFSRGDCGEELECSSGCRKQERGWRLLLNAMAYDRAEQPTLQPWVARILGGVIGLFALVPLGFALLGVALYGSTDTSTAEWSVPGALGAVAPFVGAGMGGVVCAVHLLRAGRSSLRPRLAGSLAWAAVCCAPFIAVLVYLVAHRA
jgi:hypothetical protein